MKRHPSAIALLCIVCSFAVSASAAPEPPKINAKSAILVDALTGSIIYERNCHMKREPASTTKIMTAILALEHGKLDDKVTASRDACKTEFSSMHLKPGESLTLHDLMYGMLLRSANDAAVCAAEYVAGSESKFADMMNAKAVEIGAVDTHFVNPHGLHNLRHYTTAYDLALIARYAVQIPAFNEIVRTKGIRINRSINTKDVTIRNTARFLWKFSGADGIKTGHTKESGRCFVGSVTRGKWRLISVVLGSKDAGTDTSALMNYAFKYYKQIPFARTDTIVTTVPVKGGVAREVGLVPSRNLALITNRSKTSSPETKIDVGLVTAPVRKGEVIGTLTAFYESRNVGSANLLAADSVDRTLSASIWVWTRNTLIAGIFLITGLFTYGTAVAKATRRRRRRIAKAGRKSDSVRSSER